MISCAHIFSIEEYFYSFPKRGLLSFTTNKLLKEGFAFCAIFCWIQPFSQRHHQLPNLKGQIGSFSSLNGLLVFSWTSDVEVIECNLPASGSILVFKHCFYYVWGHLGLEQRLHHSCTHWRWLEADQAIQIGKQKVS